MNVRSTARRLRAGVLFGLVATTMLLGAGCSFESGVTGLECSSEGLSRDGEVCRDGYWRIDEDAELDASDERDVPELHDGGVDGCTSRSDQEICSNEGTCTSALSITDRCTGAERTIDCTPFFDLQTNPDHCGACDAQCPPAGPHATASCAQGACRLACEAGWVDANGDAADGCESECTPSNGGVETCDGIDNDCDGTVDGAAADDAEDFFRDADGDGYGDSAQPVRACADAEGRAPEGYVDNDLDCDDGDAQISPDADEVCDGQVDDNCDQSVDEQCPCTNGETRPCGSDEGICEQGTQTCANDQWSQTCSGQVAPEIEVCDGLDNNCDGQVDETFGDKGSSCTVGQGQCENSGTYVCTSDGSGLECDATAHTPVEERCDGLDNDCDGQVDETFGDKGSSCTVGEGECAATGALVCAQDGSGTVCDAVPGTPAAEICGDALDNDCNGQVDDGCQCDFNGSSEGVCANGVLQADGQCQAPATYEDSQESTCDGLDNDCDGYVDEWMTEQMYPDADDDGYGDASSGQTRVCPGTAGWAQNNDDCDDGDPWTYPGADEICDGKDNNCNGHAADNRDTGYMDASNWCSNHYNTSWNLMCDNDGPGGVVCCDYDGDANQTFDCDFESICHGGVDEDGDGTTDCADTDCDGLSCAPGKVCESGSCQAL